MKRVVSGYLILSFDTLVNVIPPFHKSTINVIQRIPGKKGEKYSFSLLFFCNLAANVGDTNYSLVCVDGGGGKCYETRVCFRPEVFTPSNTAKC